MVTPNSLTCFADGTILSRMGMFVESSKFRSIMAWNFVGLASIIFTLNQSTASSDSCERVSIASCLVSHYDGDGSVICVVVK